MVHAACGAQHTVAVTRGGGLVGWGAAEFGQLGTGDMNNTPVDQPHPRPVKGGLPGVRFVQVACGEAHSLALTSSGHVFSFGQGACELIVGGKLNDSRLGSHAMEYIVVLVTSYFRYLASALKEHWQAVAEAPAPRAGASCLVSPSSRRCVKR